MAKRSLLLMALLVGCRSSPPVQPPPTPAATRAPTADARTSGGPGCPDEPCQPPLLCARYYGVAGARGPQFTQCVRRCDARGQCPEGERCVTIADGPGRVCEGSPALE